MTPPKYKTSRLSNPNTRFFKGALQLIVDCIRKIELAHVRERVLFRSVELDFASLSPLKSVMPVALMETATQVHIRTGRL